MNQLSVTEFRRHLFDYLDHVEKAPFELTLHGKVIAQVLPPKTLRDAAQARLLATRKTAKILDIESPLDITWTADENNFTGH